jgi:hypothetical protein
VGEALPHRDKNVPSGIFKTPLEGTLRIDEIELGGDAQADLAADRDCSGAGLLVTLSVTTTVTVGCDGLRHSLSRPPGRQIYPKWYCGSHGTRAVRRRGEDGKLE